MAIPFKEFLTAIIPPDPPAGPGLRAWQWAVATLLILLAGSIILNVALTWGFISVFGFTGFATANDLKAQQSVTTDIRLGQIENALKAAVIANCQAQQEGNQQALTYSSRDLEKAVNDFSRLMREMPRIPACSEVIATAHR